MKGLLGIHITPPDFAVVPPTRSVFSRITTDRPPDRMTSAAHMDPPPLPTTTKSKLSSNPLMLSPSLKLGLDLFDHPLRIIEKGVLVLHCRDRHGRHRHTELLE